MFNRSDSEKRRTPPKGLTLTKEEADALAELILNYELTPAQEWELGTKIIQELLIGLVSLDEADIMLREEL